MMNTYAVIPARGGSERIPHKNIVDVCGAPLISYIIRAAADSCLFHAIYVNSDSNQILKTAERYGAMPYNRPKYLGEQQVYIINVLQSMIDDLGWKEDDIVAVMLPTCPLCTEADVKNAHTLFTKNGGRHGVVSVSRYEVPIQLAHYENDEGILTPFFCDEYRRSTKSTEHTTGYRYNEAVIFNTVRAFRKQHNLVGENSLPYVMDEIRSIPIDYPYQLELVRAVMAQRQIHLPEK